MIYSILIRSIGALLIAIALLLLHHEISDAKKIPKENKKNNPLWSIGLIQLIGVSIALIILGLALLIRGN